MSVKQVNLTMVRGDGKTIGISVSGLETAPDAIAFSVKRAYSSDDFTFQKTLDDGIELTSSENTTYVYSVAIDPEDTQDLAYGHYVYDVEFTFDADRKTLLIGEFIISPDVTTHSS